MKYLSFILLLIFISCKTENKSTKPVCNKPPYAIVIHGGAGAISKKRITPKKSKQYKAVLNAALDKGESILKSGGSSMDAVCATIEILENSHLFNAGKGAVFTHDGTHELDASIMDGSNMQAGAVGGVSVVKNPIYAARKVMTNSAHVLLTGNGADEFAIKEGLGTVPNDYFDTKRRKKSLKKAIRKELEAHQETGYVYPWPEFKYGTVGCVALDNQGNIAAGTSTGGMTNKRYNRLGDSPIIGAGTYANNNTCGVSCTGHGEYFIRYAVAHDMSAQLEYTDKSLAEAAQNIIHTKLENAGGKGGIISIDKCGNVVMDYNTKGMFRGYRKPNESDVKIFENE